MILAHRITSPASFWLTPGDFRVPIPKVWIIAKGLSRNSKKSACPNLSPTHAHPGKPPVPSPGGPFHPCGSCCKLLWAAPGLRVCLLVSFSSPGHRDTEEREGPPLTLGKEGGQPQTPAPIPVGPGIGTPGPCLCISLPACL